MKKLCPLTKHLYQIQKSSLIYFILKVNDASIKIKSQDINITDNSGYKFTAGSPISTVYTGDDDTNYAIIILSNKIVIRGFGGALFGGTTGPARVYYT